jgi:hypothetical protein
MTGTATAAAQAAPRRNPPAGRQPRLARHVQHATSAAALRNRLPPKA